MKTIILFPCEYDNLKKVDENFQLEYNECVKLGFEIALFDHDLFVSDKVLKTTLKEQSDNYQIILRSWMLKIEQYTKLDIELSNTTLMNDMVLLNEPIAYRYLHHFPHVYENIKEYMTPVSSIFSYEEMMHDDNLLERVNKKIKTDILIKDYVKSEKGTDLFILKKDYIKQNLEKVINDFVNLRGDLFNDGIVLKEVVELKRYNGITNEWRAFVFYGELLSLKLNSEENIISNKPDVNFINEIISKMSESIGEEMNHLYTIDVAELEDGSWKVLECGDGQVSGLATTQDELEFYTLLKEKLDEIRQS